MSIINALFNRSERKISRSYPKAADLVLREAIAFATSIFPETGKDEDPDTPEYTEYSSPRVYPNWPKLASKKLPAIEAALGAKKRVIVEFRKGGDDVIVNRRRKGVTGTEKWGSRDYVFFDQIDAIGGEIVFSV